MTTTGQEYARLLRIAGIGIAVGSAWKQRTFRINCEDVAANAKWWHQLRLLGRCQNRGTMALVRLTL